MTNRKNENNIDCPDRNYEDEKSQGTRKAPIMTMIFWKCIVNPYQDGC